MCETGGTSYLLTQYRVNLRVLNPITEISEIRVWRNAALVCMTLTVYCACVGNKRHKLPSHPISGEPQGIKPYYKNLWSRSVAKKVKENTALVCMTVHCTCVRNKWQKLLSQPISGELKGFSSGMLTNKQTSTKTILLFYFVEYDTDMLSENHISWLDGWFHWWPATLKDNIIYLRNLGHYNSAIKAS